MFELNNPKEDADVYAAQLEHLGWKTLTGFLNEGENQEAPDAVPGSTADVPDMDVADGGDKHSAGLEDGRTRGA